MVLDHWSRLPVRIGKNIGKPPLVRRTKTYDTSTRQNIDLGGSLDLSLHFKGSYGRVTSKYFYRSFSRPLSLKTRRGNTPLPFPVSLVGGRPPTVPNISDPSRSPSGTWEFVRPRRGPRINGQIQGTRFRNWSDEREYFLFQCS